MLRAYAAALRALTHNVRLYLFATGLIGFAFDGGVFSVLFNLYLLRLGFGPEFIGQVNSAGLLAFALSSLPAGPIGARFGIRATMIVGLIMMTVGGAATALATNLPARWHGPTIMALWIVMFVGLALYFVNSVPFVMEVAAPDERHHAFPLQTALLALAAFSGALVGGFLPRLFALWMGMDAANPIPYRLPLLFASLMLLPAVVLILRIPQSSPAGETVSPDEGPVEAPVSPLPPGDLAPARATAPQVRWESSIILTLVLLSVVRFFQVSGVATTGTFFNVYMDTTLAVPTDQIGLMAGLARLGGVFAALGTSLLVTRWGAPRVVLLASAVSTLSLLPLAFIPHWTAAGIGFVGVTAMSSMRYPAFMLYAVGLVPPSWRGTLAGVGEFAGGISFAGIALIGGYLIAADGFTPLFLLGFGLTLVGTLLFYLWFMLPRTKTTPAPAARTTL